MSIKPPNPQQPMGYFNPVTKKFYPLGSTTLEQIALDIADESEWSMIECHYDRIELDGQKWFDTSEEPPACEPEMLTRAQAYLEMRGLLEHHPYRPELIRAPLWNQFGHLATEAIGQS